MSAETLRKAAALIRERAPHASDSPWTVDARPDGRTWIDQPEDRHAISMHGMPANAEHIASWHPAVALAVADWLDTVAAWELCDALMGESFVGPCADTAKVALTVARAYLGEAA
jgi:hypothetical protein